MFAVNASIDCFKCVSINGANPACDDPFHNNYTRDILESPCMGGRKGRNGLFPATACIKLTGVYGEQPGCMGAAPKKEFKNINYTKKSNKVAVFNSRKSYKEAVKILKILTFPCIYIFQCLLLSIKYLKEIVHISIKIINKLI